MDFLLVTDTPPYPLRDDHRALIYYLAYELAMRHYVVDLACFYHEPEDLAEIPRYESLFREVVALPHPQISSKMLAARLKNKPASPVFPTAPDQAWSPEMWQTLRTWVNDRAYGFAHFIGQYPLYEYFPLVKRLPNLIHTPRIASSEKRLRLNIPTVPIQQKRQIQAELPHLEQYEQWLYTSFEGVVVPTPHHQKVVETLAPEVSITCLPLGINADYFVPTGYEPRQSGILFIADFSDPVAIQAALRLNQIFPTIKRSIPQANLFLLGDHLPKEIFDLASETVNVIGDVPDLRPYFELATIFISPFTESVGFRSDLLKAFAMMTPIVATPASLAGLETLQHEQDLFIATTDDELIRAAIRLLREDQTRLRLQLNGRERLRERYLWQRVADQFEDYYVAITEKHGHF